MVSGLFGGAYQDHLVIQRFSDIVLCSFIDSVSLWIALQSYITDSADVTSRYVLCPLPLLYLAMQQLTLDSRPRWFALCEGISSAASAIGPTIGPLAINYSGSILSVFYVAAGGIILCIIFMALFIPESLSAEARRANADRIDREEAEKRASSIKATTMLEYGSKLVGSASAFLAPLAIFLPQQKVATSSDFGRRGTGWNLALVASAYGIFVLVQSVGYLYSPSAAYDSVLIWSFL